MPEPAQWHDPVFRCLGVELRMNAEGPPGNDTVFALFNAGPAQVLTLPDSAPAWRLILDTTRPDAVDAPAVSGMAVPANAILVFTPDPAGGPS
jgi:glycogen operon protein